jgi:predicted thioredoxin/glutaredoxin
MVEPTLLRQRVDPDRVEELREWTREVRTRPDEHVETLRHEGVYTETAFLERIDGELYLTYYMETERVEAVYEAFEHSEFDIDAEHEEVMREVLESGENVADAEVLYHQVNPDRPADVIHESTDA